MKRALISVSNKTNVDQLAKGLMQLGYEIVSSGGTARFLRENGCEVISVDQVTGFPEMLDGRVKTLNPRIHGGILARQDLASHMEQLKAHDIKPFNLVVVNLYPFSETVSKAGTTVPEAIEQIDIGGPTLVRASAKNFEHITILTDPQDYDAFLAFAESGPDRTFNLNMAKKAFHHTYAYDLNIANYFENLAVEDDESYAKASPSLPEKVRLSTSSGTTLRYGENPHQAAKFYPSEHGFEQLHGKELSFNNLVDMESAWRCALDFDTPAAVIVKHTNPCGAATKSNLQEAFLRARKVDPISSFGGVIAVNRALDLATAQSITEQFVELVIAPEFEADALKHLMKKKNVRILKCSTEHAYPGYDFKTLASGLLVQTVDRKKVPFSDWRLVSKAEPNEGLKQALQVSWRLVAHVKSNAIVYADQEGAVGIGAGQMSRVDSAKIAIWKAKEAGLSVTGSAMASDAFFPFRDSIDAAAAEGVAAIVQPGGSIRDEEVIQAADEHGMVLYFTGQRHFKH